MRLSATWDPVKWGEDPVTKVMTEKTGVKLICSAPSGDGDQVANVMLVSGDYPDLMQGYTIPTFKKYVAAGALWAIDDLVEQYNFPHVLDGTTVPAASLQVHRSSSDDGKLYQVPEWFSEDGFGSVGQSLVVRNDTYEQLGKPEIKTMDDFYSVLETTRDKKLTYHDVNMWPLAIHWQDKAILGDVANIYGSNIYQYMYYNEDTKKVEFCLRAPEMTKALEFLNKCYNNGILDPECFTFDDTQQGEAYAQGKYVFSLCWFWNMWTADSALMQEDPNQYYTALELPQGTPGKQQYFGYIHTAGDVGFTVTKNCKDPEAAIRFIDFCLSDEGEILDFYGVEGETMEFRDGVPWLMDGVYEAKLADWAGYGKQTGVRLWDRMKSQKWNWERQIEAPIRSANRAIASKYAFDATFLKPIQVDAATPEGILYGEIDANYKAQMTEIIIEPDASKVASMVQDLLSSYEGKGLVALEDAWTVNYERIAGK
ncbi:MAG: extracellular solute-binding protein [Eubacteriales bacterium]|nr:extracellular solute-binding protein [Eubacteriales bacterium]